MTTDNAANPSPKIEVFRHQMGAINYTMQANLAGISHEQSNPATSILSLGATPRT